VLRIAGERVVLRDWAAADLPSYRHWLRPEQEWHRWDAPYFGAPTSGDADATVSRLAEQCPGTGSPSPATGGWRLVGIVLHDPRTWSGGRGSEALSLWASYLFDSTAAIRLDFATWSGNERMCRLGRRLGWVEEARFRQAREVRGQRYDSVVYGVLREEWCARSRYSA